MSTPQARPHRHRHRHQHDFTAINTRGVKRKPQYSEGASWWFYTINAFYRIFREGVNTNTDRQAESMNTVSLEIL